MKNNKLRVGIAGYGIVGKRRRNFIDQHSQLQTIAVCDRVFSGAGVLDDGVDFYDNYNELLDYEQLDILFVCLTNDLAPKVTVDAISRGIHVFCEKPPGRTVDDIKMVREVEKNNKDIILMYGFNHRYHDSVQDALKIIRSEELGKVINLRGVYGKANIFTFGQDDWRTKRAIAGGGVLLDQGIHMVDLMRLFAGEFVDVHSFISNNYWDFDVEDNAYAIMRTTNGIVGMLHSSATQWRHRFSLDVNLEGGSINLGGILSGSKSYGAETLTVVWSESGDNGDPKEQLTRYNNDPSWKSEISTFVEAVISRTHLDHGGSLDALRTMELVYKIYQSDPEWAEQFGL